LEEIRRLETEDLLQFYKIHTVVYNLRRDYSKEDSNHADTLDHPADWAIGVFDGKKLLAGTYEIDFLMRFDGHSVKMSGIGGVGTLPEARKRGYIRRIFEKMLPEEYEKGVIFSNLAPFSHDFYRKFGYEICSSRKNINIPSDDLSKIKCNGQFIHILPGDDISELAKIHSAYISNINHGIHRDYWPDNRAWKRFTGDDPYKSGTFIYLWKDEKGIARSYIKYQDGTDGDGEHVMKVREIAFMDKNGLYGSLSLAGSLSPQLHDFKWEMPAFIDPTDFSGDAWSIDMKINPREMSRIVNVKAALELMRRPGFDGKYVVETEDKQIPANTGKYLVEFTKEGAKVSSTAKEPDIRCDILTLNQLVTGYRSLENALLTRREGLEVYNNIETLKNVFTLRPQHITEGF
jgi:predicted acetyltransferase